MTPYLLLAPLILVAITLFAMTVGLGDELTGKQLLFALSLDAIICYVILMLVGVL